MGDVRDPILFRDSFPAIFGVFVGHDSRGRRRDKSTQLAGSEDFILSIDLRKDVRTRCSSAGRLPDLFVPSPVSTVWHSLECQTILQVGSIAWFFHLYQFFL